MPWELEEEEQSTPAGHWVLDEEEPPKRSNVTHDPVSEELARHGYQGDPTDVGDEFERAAERGGAEVARGALSGATLGASEHIPTLKPEKNVASATGEILGSVIPITGLSKIFAKPLITLASKSPIAAKGLSSLAHIAGAGATGASYEAAKTAISGKMPTAEDVAKHGASWATLDALLRGAGATGRFASGLVRKAKATKKPTWQVVNDTIAQLNKGEKTADRALTIIEEGVGQSEANARAGLEGRVSSTANDLKTKRLDPERFSAFSKDVSPLARPYVPENLNAVEIAEETGNRALEERINNVSQRASTEKELGSNIQKDINAQLKEAEDLYKPAYDLAEEAAETINYVPLNTSRVGTQILENIQSLKTKPEGYPKVMKHLETILQDAGFNVEKNSAGEITQVVSEKDIPLKKLMELGRRVGKVIDYESVEKSIQDRLKPVQRAIKQDIRTALRQNPDALELWEQAEKEFGETAQRFGRESIRKIRGTQATESIASLIKSPTNLSDLKSVLTEAQYSQVERELLEKMNGMTEEKARSFLRESGPYLTPETRSIAEEVVVSKMPREAPGRSEKINNTIRETVFNDLARSTETGERPEKVLDLWKTKKGQQIIKDTLKNNPNRDEILTYLGDQSVHDLAATVVDPKGKVDFKKLNKLMQDPMTIENVRTVGGEDAVSFFKNLDKLSEKVQKNLELAENIPDLKEKAIRGDEVLRRFTERNQAATAKTFSSRAQKYLKKYGVKPKLALSVLGVSTVGVVPTIATNVAIDTLTPLIKSKRLRNAFQQAASVNPQKNSDLFFSSLESFLDGFPEQ